MGGHAADQQARGEAAFIEDRILGQQDQVVGLPLGQHHPGAGGLFGIERLAQLLYGIDHVKHLWDGDVRFAEQF